MKASRLVRQTILGVLVLFGALVVATSAISGWNLNTLLSEQYESKGAAIASSVASSSVEIILNRDASTLQSIIDQYTEIQGVSYVFIVDDQGEIVAHTFVPSIPKEAFALGGEKGGVVTRNITIEGTGDFADVSSPILAGVAGYVHVGMDKGIIAAQIRSAILTTVLGISFVLVVLVSGLALWLTRRITGPILALTDSARRIERGEPFDPNRLVELTRTGDEMADLSRVFTQMASALERRAEDERVAAEARYRSLFDGVPVGLYRTSPEGYFMDANPALVDIMGFPDRESLMEVKVSGMYVNPDDLARWREETERNNTMRGFEFQLRRQDGAAIWVRNSARVTRDDAGRAQYYDGTIEDITHRKMAEEKLRDAMAELDRQYHAAQRARSEAGAILDSASDTMVLVSPEGQIVSVNSRFDGLFSTGAPLAVTGRRIDEFSQDFERIFTDAQGFRTLMEESLADRVRQFAQVVSQQWPVARELHLYSTPVVSLDSEFLGRLYVFRDVTREHEVDRMKSEFVSLVSHELRTPLTSIKGYVDLLMEGEVGEVPEEQLEFLGIVKSNADRLVTLINDLLDISRIESGRVELKLASLNVARIIQGVVTLLRPQIEAKGQRLTLDLPAEIPETSGDSDRVTQIITNLVSNAHKYTPAGGTIAISLRAEGEWVRVAVQDSGIGLSEEEQAQLFTKFFRAKNRVTQEVGGTGLGLPIVKSLVEMHGGKITVSSAPGQGSTFSFTLAAVKEVCEPSQVEETILPAGPGGLVLVVDDEPDIANLLRRYLARGGYDVLVAGNGTDAFRLAKSELPDLITLDVKLPDVDGFTVLEWLKNDPATRAIPVLMISMLAEEAHGKLMGAVDYITKPADENALLERVARNMSKNRAPVVLVADDDADLRRLLSGHLRRAGYQVLEARDGIEALDLARREKPGLLLLDLRMPGMDGVTTLRELRADESTRDMPVLIMTASPGALEEGESQMEALGVSGLLHKPFSAEEMASAIAQGLTRRSFHL